MVSKISRDLCLIKYRKFPLCEYDLEIDDDVYFYPKNYSIQWFKLDGVEVSSINISNQLYFLFEVLKIDEIIFFCESNKYWISNYSANRKNYKPLIKTLDYFKNFDISDGFNGGVKVNSSHIKEFLSHFFLLTQCCGDFHDCYFMDKEEKYLFYLHYSGDLRVTFFDELTQSVFLNDVVNTKFILVED